MNDGCSLEQIKASCESGELSMAKVNTPEWGEPGFVWVRGLKAPESGLVSKLSPKGDYTEEEKGRRNTAAWCIACVCNEDGARKFPDEAMDFLLCPESDWAPTFRCGMKALEMNGFTDELVKNLEKTRSDKTQ